MARDPRAEADAYLRAHGITELFADLGARLMFERPKDANAFLLEELERVQDDRGATFFTDADVAACFAALDPHGTGKVTSAQYAHALKSLGIDAPREPLAEETIAKDDFLARLKRELAHPPRTA
jgi:hypothetical protein